MKKFTIPCNFGSEKHPFAVYVGSYSCKGRHPLEFQARWLSEMRGGAVPSEVMESFHKLLVIAEENAVSFEELCMYALGQANEEKPSQEQTSTNIPTAAVPFPIENHVEVLLDAAALRQCFDSSFNLLLITMAEEGQVWQISLIVRAEKTAELKTKIEAREIGLSELDHYGTIQFKKAAKSAQISEDERRALREKFVAENCS